MPGTIRLLYVITKLELGGAQKQLLSLIQGLDGAGYQIFLFTCRTGILLSDAQALPGVTLIRSRHLDRTLHPWRDVLSFFELRSIIRTHSIDIVHTHSSKAGIIGRMAARSCGVRAVVHTVHGWSFHDNQPGLFKALAIGLERWASRFTRALVVVSEADRHRGVRAGIGVPAQYFTIGYGICARQFQNPHPEVRQELGIPAGYGVVGTVACFKPQKAPLDFVRMAAGVAAQVPQTAFIMAGDGALRPAVEAAIRRAGLREQVVLTGWRRDIPRLMSCFDVFVLTSLWEGLPVAVLEAMAAGVPVVATDTGGVRDVIAHGRTGFLIPCHDSKALISRVEGLLKDPQERVRIGRQGQRSLDHTVEEMVNKHCRLYERFKPLKIA